MTPTTYQDRLLRLYVRACEQRLGHDAISVIAHVIGAEWELINEGRY